PRARALRRPRGPRRRRRRRQLPRRAGAPRAARPMSIDVAGPGRRHGPRSEALHARSMRERIPIMGGLELTFRCNLACVHCYVNLAPNDREAARRELTTDEWYRVIDQVADAGTLWLTLTGG